MKLLNGRGQLGTTLKTLNIQLPNTHLYHTWNFTDKSQKTQCKEFEKLEKYLSCLDDSIKLIFISTAATQPTYYSKYKKKAERLVLDKSRDNLIIRLPCIIGKGIFTKLYKNKVTPCGKINFTTLEDAIHFVTKNLNASGTLECPHWSLPATIVLKLIRFGDIIS